MTILVVFTKQGDLPGLHGFSQLNAIFTLTEFNGVEDSWVVGITGWRIIHIRRCDLAYPASLSTFVFNEHVIIEIEIGIALLSNRNDLSKFFCVAICGNIHDLTSS